MPLTETDIKALKPHPERHRWVNDGAGLYLRIAPSGRRTWTWRTKRNGTTRYTTIGEWPALSVKAARAALSKRTGRATPPNALTVKDAFEEWYSDQIEPNYRRVKNMRVYVDRAIAEFGSRRLQELARREIAHAVRVYGKETPVAANRCLATWKLALGWCVEVGYLEHSPAEGLTRRVAGGDEQPRSRVLSDAEIRALWRLEHPNANLLRALLLTGCRIAELQKAAASNLQGDWLFIPAAHSKNGRAHRVFLVPETRAQFNGRPPLLFRAAGTTAVQKWLQRLQTDERTGKAHEPWASIRPIDKDTQEPHADAFVPHDLRRTFATRMGELGIAPHVIEKLLNHTAEGMAAIYNRAELLEERIAATKLWAAELARIVA
jgi:integrase